MADLKLTCPGCGYDGKETSPGVMPGFRYVESASSQRSVIGFNTAGKLVVDSWINYYNDEGGDHLQCGHCLNNFPIPCSEEDVEWV